MSTPSIDLMILGALKEHAMSAYEMDKLMDARSMRKWVRVSSPSIYRNIIKLCKDGCAESHVVKEGAMPEKTIYTITDKGLARFDELMQEVAQAPVRVDFDFVSIIANLYVTDEETGRELLHTLRASHLETVKKLEAYAKTVPRLEARATLELASATYQLIADWLERYEQDFYQEGLAPELRGWVDPYSKDHPVSRIEGVVDAELAWDHFRETCEDNPE